MVWLPGMARAGSEQVVLEPGHWISQGADLGNGGRRSGRDGWDLQSSLVGTGETMFLPQKNYEPPGLKTSHHHHAATQPAFSSLPVRAPTNICAICAAMASCTAAVGWSASCQRYFSSWISHTSSKASFSLASLYCSQFPVVFL